jgi:translation initiation factor eIF-2B subunit beta
LFNPSANMTSQMVEIHTPDLKWWLAHLENDFHPVHSIDLFVKYLSAFPHTLTPANPASSTLKRRSIRNPTPTAVGTAQLLLRLIAAHKFTSIQNLVDYVLSLEDKLASARPQEMSIRNMVRRVLGIIREEAENAGYGEHFKAAMEAAQARKEPFATKPAYARAPLASHTSFANPAQASVTSLFNILSQTTSPQAASAANSPPGSGAHTPTAPNQPLSASAQKDIRPAVIQDIRELVEELESSETSIAEYAPQVIHKNETIMTYGLPSTIHRLLLRAAHKRDHDFTVVVVEGSPNIFKRTHGAVMNKIPLTDKDETASESETTAARKSLQERGVQVIVISDADIFNFIGRVNKVFLAANYVLTDGSVLATAGALNVARAANTMKKPVVVVAGSHVLCPVTSYHQEVLIEMGQPVAVGYEEGELLDKADFPNPLVDLVGAQFVTMFVTNKYVSFPRLRRSPC